MADVDRVSPFRWDVTQRSQLGSLPDAGPPETYPELESELLTCCTRLLAFAGDSDLVFVGRSPHAIFDLLSGLLLDTSWGDRLRLRNISLTYDAEDARFGVLGALPRRGRARSGRSYFAGRWGDPDETAPWRSDEARDAVALALHLFGLGRSRDWRLRFAKELARQPAMTESWFRSLILELKR